MTTPASTPAKKSRRNNTVRDMVISLGVLVVPLLLFVWWSQPSPEDAATTVDAARTYQAARSEAKFTVREPAGLPSKWKATNATIDRGHGGKLSVRVSYMTGDGQYAQVLQSDFAPENLIPDELGEGKVRGTTSIGSAMWQEYGTRRAGETALVLSEPTVTVIVTGDASLDELKQLAASLQ